MTAVDLAALREHLAKADGVGKCLKCEGSGWTESDPPSWCGCCDDGVIRVVAPDVRALLVERDRFAALVGDRIEDRDLAQEAKRRERGRIVELLNGLCDAGNMEEAIDSALHAGEVSAVRRVLLAAVRLIEEG